MDQSTTVVDIDFGMSQLSGNKKLLFTLLGKFTDEYRSLDADLPYLVSLRTNTVLLMLTCRRMLLRVILIRLTLLFTH